MKKFVLRPHIETDLFQITSLTGANRWKVNTYIVQSKEHQRSLIIDPGEGDDELISYIHSSGYRPDAVLLTHGHFDHLASAEAICSEFLIKCFVHSADHKLVRQAPFYGISFGGIKVTSPKQVSSFDSLESYLKSWCVEIKQVPGHTPGGCAFVIDKYLFTGDTLIKEAVGRTDNPGSNSEDLKQSITEMLNSCLEDLIILPGHGRPWTLAEAKKWWDRLTSSPPVHDTFILESGK